MSQICTSVEYVASKDQKEFVKDLEKINKAFTKEVMEDELLNLEQKWVGKSLWSLKAGNTTGKHSLNISSK